MNDDAVFWDRLEQMPPFEAEQELTLRRENIALELAMLTVERTKINPKAGKKEKQEWELLGRAIFEVGHRMTKINERIKYLRKLQDKIHWRNAVRALFGDEAVAQCVIYMETTWSEIYDFRRDNAH